MDAFSFLQTLRNSNFISNNPIRNINNTQLKALIVRDVTIIDVRIPYEWEDTGIIQSSIPILFIDEKGRTQERHWMKQVSKYTHPKKGVALICKSGRRSRIAAEYLAISQGYKKIYNLVGGIQNWIAEGNETIQWTKNVA